MWSGCWLPSRADYRDAFEQRTLAGATAGQRFRGRVRTVTAPGDRRYFVAGWTRPTGWSKPGKRRGPPSGID